MEEDLKILEHYEIDIVEYPNGYKSVRNNKDNTFSAGIYIYATEEYGKNEIDNLLKNAIPKSKIKEKIEEIDKAIMIAQGEELLIFEAKKDFAQELLENN